MFLKEDANLQGKLNTSKKRIIDKSDEIPKSFDPPVKFRIALMFQKLRMLSLKKIRLTVPEKESTKTKDSYTQPFWVELLKNNYRDIMKDLRNLTNEDIKFNVAETSATIIINIFSEEN